MDIVYIKLRYFKISPIPLGGYVEVPIEDLCAKKRWQIVLFFESGSIANIILLIFGLVLDCRLLTDFGLMFLLGNHLPFNNSDFLTLTRILKLKKGQ